ncbi:MAG: DNA-3-methyladenine glycosylase 2 family protein [Bryobacterales bacterium]|nr:DNA-3-methyladenine glycosylase 2 family protein [Bryobacterales bacterium]
MRRAISYLKKSDPVLKAIIERVGPYRISYREPTFDTLVRSIIYQQISGRVAAAITGRLEVHGLEPASVLALTDAQMRSAGLSRQKIGYLRDLAERTLRGEIDFGSIADLADEDVIKHLTAVNGIGIWTAQMFLIFALRRPDVLPTGDLGVRAAIKRAWELPELPPPARVLEYGQPWRPWASVATWYLWRSLEGPAAL